MPLSRDLMGAGFSAGQATGWSGNVHSSVTAAGTSQSDATALTASVNVITTAAAGSGVRLPAMNIGDDVWVLNLGAGACVVYPATGERINSVATNSGFVLSPNTAVIVKKFTTTRLVGILSA